MPSVRDDFDLQLLLRLRISCFDGIFVPNFVRLTDFARYGEDPQQHDDLDPFRVGFQQSMTIFRERKINRKASVAMFNCSWCGHRCQARTLRSSAPRCDHQERDTGASQRCLLEVELLEYAANLWFQTRDDRKGRGQSQQNSTEPNSRDDLRGTIRNRQPYDKASIHGHVLHAPWMS